MGSDATEKGEIPLQLCSFKVHHLTCVQMMKLVERITRLFPQIEASRPRCSSGIQALVALSVALDRAKQLLRYCSETSKLYSAMTGKGIVGRFLRSRKRLEQSLTQLQTMIPPIVATELSPILDDLEAANFVMDPSEEEAGQVMLELLHHGADSAESQIRAFQVALSKLRITSQKDVVIEMRSIKKLLVTVGDSDPKKTKILMTLLYLSKKYKNSVSVKHRNGYHEGTTPITNNMPNASVYNRRGNQVVENPNEDVRWPELLSSDAAAPPEEFRCPISRRVMYDPVIIASGQTYERMWIQKWFDDGNDTCPKTKLKLGNRFMTPNTAMKALISKWCINYGITITDPTTQPLQSLDLSSDSIDSLSSSLNDIVQLDISSFSLGSLDASYSFDLGIWTSSVPESGSSGILQSLQPQIVSCFQLQEAKKKVSDRMLDITESIQMEVTNHLALFELKPAHCNSMDKEVLYISKSPSLQSCAHNFVSLFFPFCTLRQLWKGGEQLLVSLKHLDAKHSNLLWIPNLLKARALESLNLEGCADLVGVSSIQYLTKLQHLNLKGCRSLKGLPSLIRLKLLKTLDLSHCSNLTSLPPSLGCLPSLCELNLKNCVMLEKLPRSVMHLMKSLETLNISGCSKMLNSISGSRDAKIAVPLSTQPPFVPSSGATQNENLPSNSPISMSTEDSCLESQPTTAVHEDSAEDSPLQDLSSDLQDIRGKKTVEAEDDDSTTIPLILSLLSKIRTALSLPADTGSSHASSSSAQDNHTLAINHTENNKSAVEEGKNTVVLQIENQQLLCKDDDHEDTKSEEKLLSPSVESVYCQVKDCEVDLSAESTYNQQHNICEVHSKASEALVGNALQRFCHQCCRFHDLIDFDEGERNCRNRLAGYHQKQRRQSSAITGTEEEHSSPEMDLEAESDLAELKRPRTSAVAKEQNQYIHPSEHQLSFSSQNWDEADAIGNIEEDILTLIEQLSSSNYDGKQVPESVLAWLAEMELTVPETVRSMKHAKAETAVVSEKLKMAEAGLFIGELELRLLDMELSRITEEEDEIEAELQRLMDKKREISQH